MDVEVSAGRDSTWRRAAAAAADDDAGGGGMEAQVVPPELYDSARAKIDANLRWLFAKAYGIDHIPTDLRNPFYTDQYEQEHIKPPIIRLLLSGELYCRVCGLILHAEQAASLQSHQSVIQVLSRKGIYVLETDNTPVSDLDLSSTPIKMISHVHLIDALMMAYMVEMISIEKVVSSVKRFSNFSASKDLPFHLEDAMVFWINKVNIKMREIIEKELKMKQHLLESPSHQKSPSKWYWKLVPVRYRRDHLSGRALQHFPLLDDLLKDVCDGTALLAVIHFYCPELIRLEDICLKEVPSIADSMYNIQLLQEFSHEYLNKCFYLKPEDMLYSPPVLKNNVMVFIAELFWWFEIVKPDFVQPRDLHEIRDVRLLLQPKTSRSHIPISNVTKRSFLASSNSADILTTSSQSPDLSSKPGSLSPSHSLLPLRQRQQKMTEESTSGLRNRSNSLTRDGQHQGSILAWPERRQRPLSQPVPYALHCPLEDDADSISLARSISKDSLASNIMTPKHMLCPQLPQHRLSGQSLLSHMRIEDEEEEMEEEELVAVIHPSAFSRCRLGSDMEQDELEIPSATSTSRVSNTRCSPRLEAGLFLLDHPADSYYLEPLMPAIPKPAKEKSISLNKEEESGESRCKATATARKAAINVPSTSQRKAPAAELNRSTFIPIPVSESVPSSLRPPTEGSAGISQSEKKQSPGFFLHLSGETDCHTPSSTTLEIGHDSDSDIADLEEDEEEDDQMELTKEVVRREKGQFLEDGEVCEFAEGESAKLREDSKVSERDDKEGGSGRSSPCLSTISWASSCSATCSTSVKMTSFAERKLLKLGLRDGFSSTSSSQKTTPDGSEVAPCSPWQVRSDGTSSWLGKEPSSVLGKNLVVSAPVVPSELLQLHMQLEEQRRAIEYQKKKMETLSARQRLKLGKAAFLNIVKKGGGKSDTLPLPLRHSQLSSELTDRSKIKTQSCRDDSCLDALKVQAKAGQTEAGQMNRNNKLSQDNVAEPDLNECSHSIDLLNEAISSIQQQMMQLSFQQNLLMKRVVSPPELPTKRVVSPPEPPMKRVVSPPEPPMKHVVSPPEPPMKHVVSPPEPPMKCVVSPPERVESSASTTPNTTTHFTSSTSDSTAFAVHFVDISGSNTAPARRPPKLSSQQRSKALEQKQSKDNSKMASIKSYTQSLEGRENSGRFQERSIVESFRPERSIQRNATFRVSDDPDQEGGEGTGCFFDGTLKSPSRAAAHEENTISNSGKDAVGGDENTRVKGQLIEVDLSELKDPLVDGSADVTDCTAEGEQKNVIGFFFKDDEKPEDEMAKRRAAFLLKLQRKAEEARLRKQHHEVESELKRDETRRKAEEDRVRKEEEKARREIIKQEYLRRKQESLLEEQGLVKPRPRTKSRRSRPKSLHRAESNSLSKGSTTRDSLKKSMLIKAQGSAAGCREADLSCSHRGSTLSLATEADSVISGGAESQRAGSVCSMESFPMLSRASSRNMERDWENGSIASSITSTEYNGPKLFKEPSSKSNKPIIINAIAHCCLAGKVNETQKNVILEELEKCESNHLIVLFRDGGCQYRGIYSFLPDTEEIIKFTGTGPRSIGRKMIDKLYKYSSDRKQFNVIPAKSVSVSVDALTIHNQLWHVKRPGSARRK
ncbi:calmodulin-regulated spectrin-associated protein 1-B-like isoform X3 [Anarrhichthys ocellatus]|uniref:calmodulin-regulated spectrin-associated protein 1-B-like isoform X3 n=1 Tax=Anarrhichthys ocellatus TaxID=433405 RepID=UPI0012ED2164|nr:calmodulin-regulated spectrin-associated protein 1-B-like isoform X3 [Anarrhichthys ocellatus]